MQDVEKIIKKVVEEFSKGKNKIKVSIRGRKVNIKLGEIHVRGFMYSISLRPEKEYIDYETSVVIWGKENSNTIRCKYFGVEKCFRREELRDKLKEILKTIYSYSRAYLEIPDDTIYFIEKVINTVKEVIPNFEVRANVYRFGVIIYFEIFDTTLMICLRNTNGRWYIVDAEIILRSSIDESLKVEKETIMNYLILNNIRFKEDNISARSILIDLSCFKDSERLEVIKKLAESILSLYLI